MLTLTLFASYSPLTVNVPVISTFPTIVTAPVEPVNFNGVTVDPPSFIEKLKSLSCDVCAIVTLLLDSVTVNSCASPITIPESVSTVIDPVVVSFASALKKFPPAISVLDVFDVTSEDYVLDVVSAV